MNLSITVLRNPDFKRLLSIRVLGMFGLQAQAVIVGWQVYQLTHDFMMLGLVGLIEAIPAIICSLFSGHLVDSNRPQRIYCMCLAALALLSTTLLLIAGGYIHVFDQTKLYVIYSCVFLSGIARSFISPSSFTLQGAIVGRKDASAGAAWMSGGFECAAIGGPAIAGLVYGIFGAAIAWIIPVVCLTTVFCIALTFSKPYREFRSNRVREPAAKSIKAGWKFILSNPLLLSVMALDMFAVLFGGAVAMLPAFADQVLHIGSEGLGLLRAAPAAGSVATSLFLALRPMQQIRARMMLWAVAGFGCSIICFGLSTHFWSAALFLALSGSFDSISMVTRGTLMQILVPDEMRGRVSAVNGMFIISSNEIGAFESGTAATLLGLVPSIIFGGAMSLVVVTSMMLISPRLKHITVTPDGKHA